MLSCAAVRVRCRLSAACVCVAQDGKEWIAKHADSAGDLTSIMRNSVLAAEKYTTKLHLLYLINDVLFHALTPGLVRVLRVWSSIQRPP
jgi:hypothetical protein